MVGWDGTSNGWTSAAAESVARSSLLWSAICHVRSLSPAGRASLRYGNAESVGKRQPQSLGQCFLCGSRAARRARPPPSRRHSAVAAETTPRPCSSCCSIVGNHRRASAAALGMTRTRSRSTPTRPSATPTASQSPRSPRLWEAVTVRESPTSNGAPLTSCARRTGPAAGGSSGSAARASVSNSRADASPPVWKAQADSATPRRPSPALAAPPWPPSVRRDTSLACGVTTTRGRAMHWDDLTAPAWTGDISNREAKGSHREQARRRGRRRRCDRHRLGLDQLPGSARAGGAGVRRGLRVRCVPTSYEISGYCTDLGLDVTDLSNARPDWCFDGADGSIPSTI